MRFLGSVVVLVVVSVLPGVGWAQLPTSDSDPRVFKGQWKWHAGLSAPPKRDKPEEACQDWAKDVRPKGQPHKFIKVKPGTSNTNEDKTCVFYDETWKKNWDQTNGAISEYVCPPDSRVITLGNAGTAATHRCWCDDGKTCAKAAAPAAPADPPKPAPPPKPPAKSALCKGKGPPPGKVDKAEAEKRSQANRNGMAKNRNAKVYADAYDNSREKIRREQNAALAKKFGGSVEDGVGFPMYSNKYPNTKEFAEENKKYPEGDFCAQGPNDVNIGYLCGSHAEDVAAANRTAGYATTPPGCTWHHHEDMGRMQLIRTDVHSSVGHWGSKAIWKRAFGLKKYP